MMVHYVNYSPILFHTLLVWSRSPCTATHPQIYRSASSLPEETVPLLLPGILLPCHSAPAHENIFPEWKSRGCTEYGNCSQQAKIIEVQVCRKTRYNLLGVYLGKHTYFTSSSLWKLRAITDNLGDSIVQNGKNNIHFLCLTQGLRLGTFRHFHMNEKKPKK